MKDEKSIGKFDFLASLSERLQSDASVKTIYGEPIEVEGKTIITVGKIAYGLGGGYGAAKGVENQLGARRRRRNLSFLRSEFMKSAAMKRALCRSAQRKSLCSPPLQPVLRWQNG